MAITDLVPWRRNRGDISPGREREYDDMVGSFYRDMNNLVDRFFRGFDIEPFGALGSPSGDFMPRVDVSENDKEIKVTVELPGMDEKDIDVSLSHDSLTIRGEKQEETEDKGKDYYRSERRYGSFHRVVALSSEVDQSKAEADFRKGVLKIKLPKTPEARATRRKIEIKTA